MKPIYSVKDCREILGMLIFFGLCVCCSLAWRHRKMSFSMLKLYSLVCTHHFWPIAAKRAIWRRLFGVVLTYSTRAETSAAGGHERIVMETRNKAGEPAAVGIGPYKATKMVRLYEFVSEKIPNHITFGNLYTREDNFTVILHLFCRLNLSSYVLLP